MQEGRAEPRYTVSQEAVASPGGGLIGGEAEAIVEVMAHEGGAYFTASPRRPKCFSLPPRAQQADERVRDGGEGNHHAEGQESNLGGESACVAERNDVRRAKRADARGDQKHEEVERPALR